MISPPTSDRENLAVQSKPDSPPHVSSATHRSPSENFISHAFPENSPKWILWHYPAYLMLGWLWQGNLLRSTSIIAEESGSQWKLMLLQTLTFTYHHYVPCCALCASPLCLCAARTDGNENDFHFVKVSSSSRGLIVSLSAFVVDEQRSVLLNLGNDGFGLSAARLNLDGNEKSVK